MTGLHASVVVTALVVVLVGVRYLCLSTQLKRSMCLTRVADLAGHRAFDIGGTAFGVQGVQQECEDDRLQEGVLL